MPTGFLRLPGEIRNEIYKYLVVQEDPIVFGSSATSARIGWKVEFPDLQKLDANILYVNKTIHYEVSSLLYSLNCFNFISYGQSGRGYEGLFQIIGYKNASYIQHLGVVFPCIDDSKDGGIIRQGFIPMLELIKKICTNLHTIELEIDDPSEYLPGHFPDCPRYLAEGYVLIDTRLRKIQSLRKILVVTNHPHLMASSIKTEMNSLGWVVTGEDGPESMWHHAVAP